ncbi:unnamed protein product [Calypogeia fissa]
MRSTFGDGEPVAHVLAIPHTIQGHLDPMLRFATQLARSGITVSFVCMEDSIPRLTSTETESPHFHFVPVQKPRTERPGRLNFQNDAWEPLMEKLINDKNAGIAGPTCIISDMFLPWTCDVAEKLKIPWYVLITSGVVLARLWQGSLEYLNDGRFQVSEADGKLIEFEGSVCISGLPPLRFYELNGIVRNEVPFLRQLGEALTRSAGVVVNSFLELEEKVVEAFRNPNGDGEKHTKVPKIYPVGPLFSTTNLTTTGNVFGLEDSSSQCIRWLDAQPSSSVLYVAFGSMARLRPEQIQELAYGLEASNQRFLWACPLKKIQGEEESPTSITEVLPPGFEERVGDRGCIVTGWAPQLEILAHTSTAGFFTHSGWNSSLESVIFGIPMISWPQGAEQHMNGRYMVDVLKIAEQLQTGKENNVTRKEVERAVRLLMVDSEGKSITKRAEELKKIAAAATAEGGSRSRIFHEFLDDIRPH